MTSRADPVSTAGDVNGDGYDDRLLIRGYSADWSMLRKFGELVFLAKAGDFSSGLNASPNARWQ